MVYGITGNVNKAPLWSTLQALVPWLEDRGVSFIMTTEIAEGFVGRSSSPDSARFSSCAPQEIADMVDIVLSFGGDGTLLNTAHQIGKKGTPILGVNLGRLGFLADVGEDEIEESIVRLEAGDFTTERRMVLEISVERGDVVETRWALNELVIERTGAAGLIDIDVFVDDVRLNKYWADGLIVATPTGSTAYSLSAGGPIVMPTADAIILTPLAPHTLTLRPIVIPGRSVVEAEVTTPDISYVFATDGRSMVEESDGVRFRVRRAEHAVNIVKLSGHDYFQTLRTRLMWGARKDSF